MRSTKKKINQAALYNHRIGKLALRRHSYQEEELQCNDSEECWYQFPSMPMLHTPQACTMKKEQNVRPVNCMQVYR